MIVGALYLSCEGVMLQYGILVPFYKEVNAYTAPHNIVISEYD